MKHNDEKMYDKVMALSDVEIFQQLAMIEGLNTYVIYRSVWVKISDGDDYLLNPFLNSQQLIDLMINHEVERQWEPYDLIGWNYNVLGGKNPIHMPERQDFDGSGKSDISMAKAVCLAIILNKSADFIGVKDAKTT